MNTFTKKTLTLALGLALVAAPTAFAFTLLTSGNATPETVATQAGSTFTMSENLSIATDPGDVVIGRTTGLQVRIDLLNGVQFGATPPVFTVGPAATGYSATLASGGVTGFSLVQFTLQPGETDSKITLGEIGRLTNLNFTKASGDVFATVQLIDPVTGTGLNIDTIQLVKRDDGLAFTCTPQGNADRIDVGTNAQFTTAKTGFVGADKDFAIGGADDTRAPLGTINVKASSGFTLDVASGGDTLTSRVTGTNLAGISSIFLATNNTCSVNIGSFTIAGNVANLNRSFALLNTAGGSFSSSGGTASLCVTVNGTTQLAAQSFVVQNGLNGSFESDVCNVAPLAFNGSVVKVYHINPAGNTTAQSFLRTINPSTTAGRVTITGFDDAGVLRGPVSFQLGARQSRQFNSDDLENGNVGKGLTGSLGKGAGKWRLEVTGEFDGMVVQGLNRNNNDGTVTNLTDADNSVEQRQENKLQF